MKKVLIDQENSGNRIDKFLMEEVFFNGEKTRGEMRTRIARNSSALFLY